MDSRIFRSYYYLKEELVAFCRENGLPVSGSKKVLADRIAEYLDSGVIICAPSSRRNIVPAESVSEASLIEEGFVCKERHRAFFRSRLGSGFRFNVMFQNWLKSHAGRTYAEAIEAYHKIQSEKKLRKTEIAEQFEYNAYIRDFFASNKGKRLEDAVRCWKFKKNLPGHNRYEPTDLSALE